MVIVLTTLNSITVMSGVGMVNSDSNYSNDLAPCYSCLVFYQHNFLFLGRIINVYNFHWINTLSIQLHLILNGIFPSTKVFFSKQTRIMITILSSMVVMNSYVIINNMHDNYDYNYSSIIRQWHSFFMLHCINTILYLFITAVYILTIVDLLIKQLHSIANGMIVNNSGTNNNIFSSNNVLFLLFGIFSIIFGFSYCNDCKIAGINIHTQLYLNNSIRLIIIFCLINIFGDAVDIKELYLCKEYGNVNNV